MLKLLLIKSAGLTFNNRSISPPLGIMYLASYLRERLSVEIKLLDLRVVEKSSYVLSQMINDFKPELVGISAVTMEAKNMFTTAEIIKNLYPTIKIIAGGPHPSQFPEKTLTNKNIDFIVYGEGEETLEEFIKCYIEKGDFARVKGLYVKQNDGFYFTGARKPMEDLDSIPYPAWDLIDIDVYKKYFRMTILGKNKYMPLFTSRGCPFQCIYCHNIFGKKFRSRHPENVIKEIETLIAKYDIKHFEIYDDIFNLDKTRTKTICDKIIERQYNLKLSFPNGLRADILDELIVEKMKVAGTNFISFAIESASPRIQKFIRKNLNIEKAKKSISFAVQCNIFTNGFFMLGFPTETKDEMDLTVDFSLNSPLHTAYFSIVTPFENTEIYNMVRDKIKDLNINFESYSYHKNSFNLSDEPTKVLFATRRRAYFSFYFSIRRILKIIRIYFRHARILNLPQYFILMTSRMLVRNGNQVK